MKLQTEYTLSFLSSAPEGLQVPVRIDFDGKIFEISEISNDRKNAKALIEGTIDTEALTIKVGPEPLDGSEPQKGISCLEKVDFRYLVSKIVHILSFLIDTPIRYSHKLGGDRIIPEGPDDERCLDALGSRKVYVEFSTTLSVRSFQFSTVTDHELKKLASKEVGMANYYQALLNQNSIAKYRDLWKVLESAFGEKNVRLVKLLAQYSPATELGFTLDELKDLLALRGRASHSESRSGIKEVRHVTNETDNRISRLKCLVEQVLITKKSWGNRSLEVDRLSPVSSYIRSDGTLVIIKSRANKRY